MNSAMEHSLLTLGATTRPNADSLSKLKFNVFADFPAGWCKH